VRCLALPAPAGELDGKNVTLLMQPHIAQQHHNLMKRFIDAHNDVKAEQPSFVRNVVGLRRNKVAMPIRLAVSRSSGAVE
jgi:hypothetical protein